MSKRTATWLAWSLCALSLILAALGLLLLALNRSYPNVHIFDYWAETTVIAVAFSTVGAIIASRIPENPIGWIFCAIGLIGGMRHFRYEYVAYTILAAPDSFPGGEMLAWSTFWLWVPHVELFVLLALLFPDGRLPSSRWKWLVWLSIAITAMGAIFVEASPGPTKELGPVRNPLGVNGMDRIATPLVVILMYALALVAVCSLLVRLHRASGVEHQQLKWIAYAGVVGAGGAILNYVVPLAISVWWISWVGLILVIAGLMGVPITVGLAILRYRLYDIDLIIHRTLVYGSLTAMLALFYLGSVTALQYLFSLITGQGQTLAVVASTLVIAALFNPLRRRIQGFIDRRFYRRKYDARKTLEVFSTRLRDQTDIERISDDLVGVIRETMQPSHVSLWLRSEVASPINKGQGQQEDHQANTTHDG